MKTSTTTSTEQGASQANLLQLQTHDEKQPLASKAAESLQLSRDRAFDWAEPDGHWCGELKTNITVTAEYIFFQQALGIDFNADREAFRHYLLSQQNDDGSWGIAPEFPGDVSTTTEAYLALRILNTPAKALTMQRAREYILKAGGVAAVRVFTRIFLASFGLFPWQAVPQLPVELILMPAISPINIYRLSSWARSSVVPLLIICHHQPIYDLPNGKSAQNDFLDELWCNAAQKSVPYAPPLWDLLWKGDGVAFAFTLVDKILAQLGGLSYVPLLRSYARRQCVKWILERQEPSGDWAGIYPPMHFSILALMLEGHKLDDPPVRLGLEALERFTWQDDGGKRIQACVSPVWDTVLMSIGLSDAGVSLSNDHLKRAISWTKSRQLLGPEGDWRIYRPNIPPGGFSFEYFNAWFPDVDDTAAALLAFVKHDTSSVSSPCVIQAAEWSLGMQNPDGGWAAFDAENDKLFMNKIPFSDMNSLCDPSSADVTGRILEAFGLMIDVAGEKRLDWRFLTRIRNACERGITYLASVQEQDGSWYGRWGSNYIYGTSNVLCGLAYFSHENPSVQQLVQPALHFLKSAPNPDGGWGESLLSYKDPARYRRASSTPSQTAWALMGLLSHLPHSDPAIERGVAHLVSSQTDRDGKSGASWPEPAYTGTGFPNHFYLGYTMYRHYFPMMALGRYLRSVRSS